MKKIILVFFLAFVFIPEKTFSLTYEKHNVVSDIGDVGKGNTETEGYFSYQINDYPLCKKLNEPKIAALRQGIRIHYDPNKKIYAFEKGIFDCNYGWEKNSTLLGIYEGMVEYLTKNIPDATAKNSEISSAYNMAEFGNAGVEFSQE